MSLKAPDYDVVIVGGGPSGLLAARELAKAKLRVRILEEDQEIGIPQRCDGLVSTRAIKELGFLPTHKVILNEIKRAHLFSPSGIKAEVDASRQGVVVVDRSSFDKELARDVCKKGAELEVSVRVKEIIEEDDVVKVVTNGKVFTSRLAIDARGISKLVSMKRKGVLNAAKYLVSARWFEKDTVELYFDQAVSPGYFTWVIPIDDDLAHVGVAGALNGFEALDNFLQRRGGSVLQKIAAPIYVGGPLGSFIEGRVVSVGDAAGQTKPLTGGGIWSCGLAGILAGKAASKSILEQDFGRLFWYEREWRKKFEEEFERALWVRRLFERLSNHQLDEVFQLLIKKEAFDRLSSDGDFDYHSISLAKVLGIRGIIEGIDILMKGELSKFLDKLKV